MNSFIRQKFSRLGRKSKLLLVFFSDFSSGLIAWITFGPPLVNAVATSFEIGIIETVFSEFNQIFFPVFFSILFLYFCGFYRSLIRFFDSTNLILVSILGSLIFGFSWSLIYLYELTVIDANLVFVIFLQGFVLSVIFYSLLNVTRIFARLFIYPDVKDKNALPVLIYGAGAAGKELMESIQIDKSKNLIGFFDDSKELRDRTINNIPIYGSTKRLSDLKKQYQNLEVLLAIPSLDLNKRREVISRLEELKISVRTVPAFHELIFDEKKMSDIQNLSLDDLIPNRKIKDVEVSNSNSREFLITGSGGSIGAEIVRQIIKTSPKKIVLLDVSEFNLFKILEEIKTFMQNSEIQTSVIPYLADVKDTIHIDHILKTHHIDTIYHAAAYKHVPLVQEKHNISKSLENNFIGTYELALQAVKHKVRSFVLISTDKAVRPTNIMGASKRMAEIAIQTLNDINKETNLSMVRFGNVLNSSGSVIPVFLEQIARGGPVTLTHKDVQRYFMTIPEASNLVIQAGEMSRGGEVFILDMGEQMRIDDIARRLIHLSGRSVADESGQEGIEIIEIGLREGEKMYEELLISGNESSTSNDKIFKSKERFIEHDELLNVISNIKEAISSNDHERIINILSDYVEGFSYE